MKYLWLTLCLLFVAPSLMAAGETLVILRSAGDDSIGWEDTYVHDWNDDDNYATSTQLWCGYNWSEIFYTFARVSAVVGVIPDGKHCDSAMYCMVILQDVGVGVLTVETHRLLRDWVHDEATWNIFSTGNNWTTSGARSDGNDRRTAWEQADSVIKHIEDAEWSTTIAGNVLSAGDTVLFQLSPKTIDSISNETITNNGWAFQWGNATAAVAIRTHSRESAQIQAGRPFLRIYYSDDEEPPEAAGQFMMIGSGP